MPEPDAVVWARWFGEYSANHGRHVADSYRGQVVERDGALEPEVRVSTVFLGINHSFHGGPPSLWETMIFWEGGPLDMYQRRYQTRELAAAGHQLAVDLVERAIERRGL